MSFVLILNVLMLKRMFDVAYVLQLNSYDADEVIGVFSSYEGAEKVREDF